MQGASPSEQPEACELGRGLTLRGVDDSTFFIFDDLYGGLGPLNNTRPRGQAVRRQFPVMTVWQLGFS